MCIIFLYTGGDSAGKYRLIVASNRDEYFARPAKRAGPWDVDSNVIGGLDMEPGREGGTWLAMSPSRGHVAALLNLSGLPAPPNAKGRGPLVTNFVMGNKSSEDYIEDLRKNAHQFSAFNLVTVDIGDTSSNVYHYSNFDDKLRTFGGKRILGFSNSSPDRPLKKTVAGTKKFEEIIARCTTNEATKQMLVKELLELLQWKERHLPDEELESRNPPGEDGLAAVFVQFPGVLYGTRTHTIIIVDCDGAIDFWEWTKVLDEAEWMETHVESHL